MEIRHHAVLYALLCKHILAGTDMEEGEKLIEEITTAYGLKRGRRMAANSSVRDMNAFFINGEWKGKEGENLSKLYYGENDTTSIVSKCAWYDSWVRYDLLDYGPYYCRYIDKAICEGFAGNFDLDVRQTIGQGEANCIFVWSAKADEEKVANTEKQHILSFDFHCKELYETAYEILPEKIRDEVLKAVDEEFVSTFTDLDASE